MLAYRYVLLFFIARSPFWITDLLEMSALAALQADISDISGSSSNIALKTIIPKLVNYFSK